MPIYKQNIDEARAMNGRVYKDYIQDVKDQIDSGSETYALNPDTNKKVGTTSTGRGGVLDSVAQNQIEKIDLEKEKAILESADMLKEYDAYINGHFLSVLKGGSHKGKGQLEQRMLDQYNGLKEYFGNTVSEKHITDIVMSNFYGFDELTDKFRHMNPIPSSSEMQQEMEKFVKNTLQLRINYVNKITSLLAKMLKINYKELGLTEEQCKIYIDSLQSGNNASVKAAGELKQLIRDNSDKYSINGGQGFDFRPLGFGCIFGTSEAMNTIGSSDNKDAMLDLLQKAIRYDAVVLAHGGEGENANSPYEAEKLVDIENLTDDTIKSVTNKSLHLNEIINTKLLDDLDITYSEICKYCIDAETIDRASDNIASELRNNNNKLIRDILDKDAQDASNAVISLMDAHLKDIRIIPIEKTRLFSYIKKEAPDKCDALSVEADKLMKIQGFVKKQVYLKIYQKIIKVFYLYNRDYTTYSSYWYCMPTRTLNGGPFTDVNKVVRQLIKEGFKTILIQDCNPGHHELAKDIMDTKGIVINYSRYENWVESGEIDFKNNPEYLYIHEAEESLKEFAKSFDIDYNNDIYLVECCNWYLDGIENGFEPLNEGVIDSLKEFFKKIVAGIVGLIKRIVNFVKTGIQKFIEMFKGTKEKPKDTKTETPKEIKTKIIDVDKKSVVEVSGKSREDFEKYSNHTCTSISNAIKDINAKQQAGLKAAEKFINDLPGYIERLKSSIKPSDQNASSQNSSPSPSTESMIEHFLNNSFARAVYVNESPILEFDANGDEKNIPGVVDDDDSDYSFGDEDESDNIDSGDESQASQQSIPVNSEPTQSDTPETVTADDDNGEYNMNDDSDGVSLQSDDQPTQDDQYNQDNDSNDDEYNLNDDTGEDQSSENNDSGDNIQPDTQDNDSNDEYNMNDDSDNLNGIDGEDGNNEDDAQSGLKKIEGELFENLSPKQKEIKIKALKQNFLDLYDRCGDVLDLISNNTPASEEESRIFDFVSKTVTELQSNVHDYLADTFGTKTYIDNDAQFKQYLVILDSVKKILDEFLNVKTDKKEETGKN